VYYSWYKKNFSWLSNRDEGKALVQLKEVIVELTLAIAALKVVGYGLAAIGPGIGIGVATYGLCVSAARQPEMKGQLMGYFFIGAAMSEALALLGLVLFFIG
jgi:F-type H+-transporting ATPase subunit c